MFNTRRKKEKNIFSVATYNMCHGEGLDNKIDVDRQASFIKKYNLDVCLLQEVDNKTSRSKGIEELNVLSNKSNLKYYYMGENFYFDGEYYSQVKKGSYGNGIISKYPFTFKNNYLTKIKENHEKRGIAHVKIKVNDKVINLFSLHLSVYKAERIEAIKELIKILDNLENEIVIVGGDFNVGIEKIGEHKYRFENLKRYEEFKLLKTRLKKINNKEITWESKGRKGCIDTIFYSDNIKCKEYKTIDNDCSDHKMIYASFEF